MAGEVPLQLFQRPVSSREDVKIKSDVMAFISTVKKNPTRQMYTIMLRKILLLIIDFRQRRVIFKLHSYISYLSSLIISYLSCPRF